MITGFFLSSFLQNESYHISRQFRGFLSVTSNNISHHRFAMSYFCRVFAKKLLPLDLPVPFCFPKRTHLISILQDSINGQKAHLVSHSMQNITEKFIGPNMLNPCQHLSSYHLASITRS